MTPGTTPGTTPDWAGLRVVVAGIGVSGFAAADALLERGAKVVVIDPRSEQSQRERGIVLDTLGADIRLGPDAVRELPTVAGEPAELLVISPGWDDDQPVLRQALAAGLPVWGEAELAWRMRPATGAAPWLSITGTRGKATTATMLAAMLTAAGHRATAIGQAGTSLLEAVLHPVRYDVLAVQLSGFQLRWATSLQPHSSVCLNVSGTDLDDGSLAARGRVYQNTELACVYNVADPVTEQLVMDAEVIEGCRAIGFTLGVPAISMLGLVDDVLADRAFVETRQNSAAELGTLRDLQGDAPSIAPHYVANALAAAALARAYGVGPLSVRDGLRSFRPDPHRIADVETVDGVRFVNDSKATNPHAASASLRSFDKVVWIAGGLLKGASETQLDELVTSVRDRLRGVVLIGADRMRIAEALARHAPDVPVVDVGSSETVDVTFSPGVDVMDDVVARAAELAVPGDVVLLAPAAASMDMFANYGARGDAFEAAVRRWAEGPRR